MERRNGRKLCPAARAVRAAGVCLGLAAGQAGAERLLLEAETMEGTWRRQTNIAGYSGEGFRTSNANPAIAPEGLTGALQIPRGAVYTVWARGYTSPNGKRAFRLAIDGTELDVTHAGDQRGWFWERCGRLALEAGERTVRVADADVGFESVDVIMLTDEEDADPMAEDLLLMPYAGDMPDAANALKFTIALGVAQASRRQLPETAEAWKAVRGEARADLAAALGLEPMPERTPLRARIAGTADRDGYRVENVLFESLPGFVVTANLLLPVGADRPLPSVVVVPGHAMADGKNYGLYLTAQLGLVKQGFAVLAYDPIGQGERRLPGFDHALGYGSLLVGRTNEGMIVWDTMRAVDYLVSRPDIDATRIGLTGNSGGGENTFYTMPLDERIRAGASCCFVCSYEDWVRDGGNHCICNHLPGIVQRLEQAHIIGLNAPRPFLAGNAAGDPIFPIAGTRRTIENAKTLYGFEGAEANVSSVEAPGGHGWSKPLREAVYGFLALHLQSRGDGSPIPEPELAVPAPDDPDFRCFKNGDAMPDGAQTIVTLNRQRAEELVAAYPPPSFERGDRRERREEGNPLRRGLAEVFGIPEEEHDPEGRALRRSTWEGHPAEMLEIVTEPGMAVPALFLSPAENARPASVTLLVTDLSLRDAAGSAPVRRLLRRGHAVCVMNPRGVGDVAVHANHWVSTSYCTGRPAFGMQVLDVTRTARYLASRDDCPRGRLRVWGSGACGLLAAGAAALEPRRIERVACVDMPVSYRYALENGQHLPLWAYVPGILKVADVPQILGLAAPAALLVLNPAGYGGAGLDPAVAEADLDAARAAYGAAGTPGFLTLAMVSGAEAEDTLVQFLAP